MRIINNKKQNDIQVLHDYTKNVLVDFWAHSETDTRLPDLPAFHAHLSTMLTSWETFMEFINYDLWRSGTTIETMTFRWVKSYAYKWHRVRDRLMLGDHAVWVSIWFDPFSMLLFISTDTSGLAREGICQSGHPTGNATVNSGVT